jgi:predicted NBD/HSP70 family sugar kinase
VNAASSGPAATELLRRQNTALLLRSLRQSGPLSRAALAQATGLAKATVSTIVADLHGSGVVREAPAAPTDGDGAAPRLGRPGRPVELHGAHLAALGLEVNVDYVAVTALDLAGRTVLQQREPLTPTDEPLHRLSLLALGALEALDGQAREVLGVAVAVPGLVDHEAGVVVTAPNLGWQAMPLREQLEQLLPAACPVRVDNDANYAALAEHAWGAARGADLVLYLTGTVGLGAGVVVAGAVQRGASGFAGEVGHAPIGGSELLCACGRRGCWETTVGLPAMLRAVGLTEPDDRHGDPLEVAAEVARRAQQQPDVAAALGEVARSLAAGVATLVSVLDPQTVVLGGYFVPLGPWLLPVVQQAVTEQVLAADARRCSVALSSLGLHAASSGAAADVLADVFSGRVPVVG